MNDVKPIEFIVEKGTFVKMNGIPVEIKEDTLMSCNPYNLTLALGLPEQSYNFPKTASGWPTAEINQPEQSAE